jgi:PBP1b-binding outer membrane lipoprotein LpoB
MKKSRAAYFILSALLLAGCSTPPPRETPKQLLIG